MVWATLLAPKLRGKWVRGIGDSRPSSVLLSFCWLCWSSWSRVDAPSHAASQYGHVGRPAQQQHGPSATPLASSLHSQVRIAPLNGLDRRAISPNLNLRLISPSNSPAPSHPLLTHSWDRISYLVPHGAMRVFHSPVIDFRTFWLFVSGYIARSSLLRQRLGHRLTICDLLIKPIQRITK